MWILLLIGLLVPLIYFGYLMSRLDQFLAENAMSESANKQSPAAIVLGENHLAKQVMELLRKNRIGCISLTDPVLLIQEKYLSYIFALSENDADNILLCRLGKKLYGVEDMICICNDKKNESLFHSEKTNYVLREGATAERLLLTVLHEPEVSV